MHIEFDPARYPMQGVAIFVGLLQAAFVFAKLDRLVTWAWWVILSPTWGAIGVAIVVFLVLFFALRNSGI